MSLVNLTAAELKKVIDKAKDIANARIKPKI